MRFLRATTLVLPLLLAGCGAQPLTIASPTPGPTTTPRVIVVVVTATPSPPTATPEAAATLEPSPTAQAASASPTAGASGAQQPPTSVSANATPGGTFRICGTSDPQAEKAIEQLINGHNFSASMVSRSDGCADLTVKVSPGTTGNGSSTTNIAVGNIAIKIVSQNGVTTAHIGAGS